MKKIFSLLLALSLVFCLASASFADSGFTEYNWSYFGDVAINMFGDNSNICHIDEVNALFWIPGNFYIVELSDEDIANNCIGYLVNEDGSAFMLLYYMDMPASATLDTLSYYWPGGSTARQVTVNDIPAVIMQDATNNTLSVFFQTAEGKLFQILFYPASDDYYSSISELIISSILPIETVIPTEESSEPVAAPVNPVSGLISK